MVLLVVSIMFQVMLDWDDLVRAGWDFKLLLRKVPIAAAVALIAAGVLAVSRRPCKDDDDDGD